MSPEPAPTTPPWMFQAACLDADPETFFPDKGGSTKEAQAICATCPVAPQCLEYALANDERWGVWGGVSERGRRKLRERGLPPGGVTQAAADARSRTLRRIEAAVPRLPIHERTSRQQPINHGTHGGYNAHRRRDEPLCDDCREAERLYRRTAYREREGLPTQCPGCQGPVGKYLDGRCAQCYWAWEQQLDAAPDADQRENA